MYAFEDNLVCLWTYIRKDLWWFFILLHFLCKHTSHIQPASMNELKGTPKIVSNWHNPESLPWEMLSCTFPETTTEFGCCVGRWHTMRCDNSGCDFSPYIKPYSPKGPLYIPELKRPWRDWFQSLQIQAGPGPQTGVITPPAPQDPRQYLETFWVVISRVGGTPHTYWGFILCGGLSWAL